MFKLAGNPGDDDGLYCGPEGLFLGPTAVIPKIGDNYRQRPESEVAALLAAAYGPDQESDGLLRRLGLIRDALQRGDLCNAMILAVHAQLGPVSTDGRVRLEKLAKHNFNPDQPRDWHGRWTDSRGVYVHVPVEQRHPRNPLLVPVQEILPPLPDLLPFGARPPFFFEDPPETIRPFKETIPRLSGKEGAKNVPSWARGQRPYVGENGRDFAKRLMDQRYGRGNWEQDRKWEYNRIKKYGDRNFRDPRSVLGPDREI